MANDSSSGRCGCGGDSGQKKEKDPCPSSEKKSGFSKTPCKKSGDKDGKGKCHESHEKFKEPYKESTDKCQAADEKKVNKCSSSYEQFTKSKGGESPCGQGSSTKTDCHESYKKFLRGNEEDCSDSRAEERNDCEQPKRKKDPCARCQATKPKSTCEEPQQISDPCSSQSSQQKVDPCSRCQAPQPKRSPREEPQPASDPCSSQSSQQKVDPCGGKADKKQNICGNAFEEPKEDCPSQKKRKPCAKSSKESKRKDPPCGSKKEKEPDDSLYSKITCRCKSLAKDFVKIKSKTKCISVEEHVPQNNAKCNGILEPLEKESCGPPAPPSGAPCPPKTEKGAGGYQPCCTSKVTCAEPKMPSWADFFPLDARNKKLNKCIEKYSKLDPSQVISKCSRFANQTMDTSSRCLEKMKEKQQQCLQDTPKSSGAGGADALAKKSTALLSTRTRVLMRRWAPTAAVYLATSALLSVYVTEWKTVMPLYRDESEDKE